jgi:hypothetical protein
MPKLYLFADACLTWHSRAQRCEQPSTVVNGGARTSWSRVQTAVWRTIAAGQCGEFRTAMRRLCHLVICMASRISSLWARQALARRSRGQNSHGGVAALIGCASRDRRTGHTLGANRCSRDLADCRRPTAAARHCRSMMMEVVVVVLHTRRCDGW